MPDIIDNNKPYAFSVVTVVLLFCSVLVSKDWLSNTEFHTLLELTATLVALFVCSVSLIRYYTEKDQMFLFIGVGFLGTAILDTYHVVLTSTNFISSYFSDPASLLAWSWTAPRLYLSVLMLLSYLVWVHPDKYSNQAVIKGRKMTGALIVLFIAVLLFFLLVPLPQAYYPNAVFSRPGELLPAILFFIATIAYYQKGDWRQNTFQYWLILSLLVNVICQAIYMPYSRQVFDGMFDSAHMLKIISYTCVLVGLLIDIYKMHIRLRRSKEVLEQSFMDMSNEVMKRKTAYEQLQKTITSLETTKARLANNKIYMDAVLDNMEEGVVACDANGMLSYFNQATIDFHGKDVCDLPTEEWGDHFDLYHADGTTLMRPDEIPLLRAYAEEEISDVEMVIAPKNGKRRFIKAYGQAMFDEQGNKLGAVVTMHDISESIAAGTALKESEERFRAAFESAANGIAIIGLDGKWLRVNPSLCEMLGYTEEEFRATDFKSLTHPDDIPEQVRNIKQLVAGEIDHYVYEKRNIHKAGHYVWVLLSATLIRDENQQPLYLLSQVQDISAQKRYEEQRNRAEQRLRESEQRFSDAFASAAHGMALVAPGGHWLKVNNSLCQMLGYTEAEFLQADFQTITHPDDLKKDLTLVHQLLAKEIDSYHLEKRYFHKQGHIVWALLSVSLVRDAADKPQYFVSQIQDLTAQKAVEQEREAQKQLLIDKEAAEAANASKSQFLANMSHELRTPLNAIIGYSEMMAEDAEEAGQLQTLDDLKKIHSSGKHLLSLINEILDLSKIEAGKMELILEHFPVQELIYEVTSTMQSMVKKNHNDFSIHYECGTVMMHSDSQKIKQILFNLLSNAAKFTADGEITLTVRSVEENTSQARLEFIVSDDGIGMSTEQIERVFSAFTQADNNTTRKYGGTGLGLAITEKFCEMLNGEIHVDSKPGEGTTFTVSIPCNITLDVSEDTPEKTFYTEFGQLSHTLNIETENSEILDSSFLDNQTSDIEILNLSKNGDKQTAKSLDSKPSTNLILVIDDDANARELLSLHLTKLNFSVVTADSGMRGVNLARKLSPVAIILDLMMPHMNGWAVLQILKGDPLMADIPVILCSMITDQIETGYILGATDYLVKPVDRNRLKKVLRRFGSSTKREVLIVEDDTTTRELLVRTAKKQGWLVTTANNGLNALKQLELQTPDLILLDLMMPEMDGFQLVDAMQQQKKWRDIPIIIMTAKDLTVEDHARLDDYVEVILEKGQYDLQQLIQQITRQVENIIPVTTNDHGGMILEK